MKDLTVRLTVMIGLLFLCGCQIDVSGSAGWKAFYPDNVGKHAVGDPRKSIAEKQSITKETGFAGFQGIGGER